MSYEERREQAIKRVKAKRGFRTHLVVYVSVNTFLVLLWAVSGGGNFWPLWPILGWGIGLALNARALYAKPISEDDINAEMRQSGLTGPGD